MSEYGHQQRATGNISLPRSSIQLLGVSNARFTKEDSKIKSKINAR